MTELLQHAREYTVRRALMLGVRAMRRHPLLSIMLLIATLSQGFLQGMLVWALRKVLLLFSNEMHRDAGTLVWGAIAIFGIWLLRVFTTYLGQQASVRLAHHVEIGEMQSVLAKFMTLSVRSIERNSQGEMVLSTYEDVKGIRQVTLALGTIVLSLSRLAGLAVVCWVISPKLAIVGLITLPAGLVPAYYFGQHITRASESERLTVSTLFDSFFQVASGFRVIKVNRAEPRVLERARIIGHDLYRFVVRQNGAKNLARLLVEAVSGLGLVAVLIIGGRDVALNHLSWQSLLSLLIAIMAVYSPIVDLLGVYNTVRQYLPHLGRVAAILATESDVRDAREAQPLLDAPAEIELQDVSFAYGEALVLQGVSATFKRGETIGIVGASGSGKSTLVSLLLRFYDPASGRILVDGVDLRQIRYKDLMDRCAIVMQEPFLFLDTVANNIRIGRPTATMEEVEAAARAANVHDEIMRMERGYDTIVGRRRDARGVSTGQKQRICIAAALLKNAPLLFLDEATSSLDSVSERRVQEALERLMEGRTTFVVAHRLSTLRAADRIMVLDRGRLMGLDSHEMLLSTCDTYRRLWQFQTGEAQELDNAYVPTV